MEIITDWKTHSSRIYRKAKDIIWSGPSQYPRRKSFATKQAIDVRLCSEKVRNYVTMNGTPKELHIIECWRGWKNHQWATLLMAWGKQQVNVMNAASLINLKISSTSRRLELFPVEREHRQRDQRFYHGCDYWPNNWLALNRGTTQLRDRN